VPWEIFEEAAPRYEDWYATPRGRRTDVAERALLAWLLGHFPSARRILEVGCGTGHFATALTPPGGDGRAIGLDRSPAMLREARTRLPDVPLVLADAARLPVSDRAVDVVALVTAIEFVDAPERVLRECVRVAAQGIVLIVLNRWSPGALARRRGPSSRGALLSRARDYARCELTGMLERAAGHRLERMRWRSALLPRTLSARDARPTRLPFGDVLGVAARLRDDAPAPRPSR
jgi:SAM-dependent methyltransferase